MEGYRTSGKPEADLDQKRGKEKILEHLSHDSPIANQVAMEGYGTFSSPL
jgi:hypothetical protein